MEVNQIVNGDCIEVMKSYPDNTFDAVICDPPYGLEFMGKEWDKLWDNRKDSEKAKLEGTGNIRNAPVYQAGSQAQDFHISWAKECLRVLKPGGHLLAFGGSRTYHRLASGIEDAGFEIRDQIMWIYGSGFPKSMNIGKAIDKMQGNKREVIGERKAHDIRGNALMEATVPEYKKEKSTFNYQFTKGNSEWEGWGTGLKPAHEPIVVARKPLSEGSVAKNCLKWRTGGINIDDCRIPSGTEHMRGNVGAKVEETDWKNNSGLGKPFVATDSPLGRFPANVIFDEEAGILLDSQSGISNSNGGQSYSKTSEIYGNYSNDRITEGCGFGDKGGASRFFYCAKASKSERNFGCEDLPLGEAPGSKRSEPAKGRQSALGNPRANYHPTVKPLKLMEYLIKLVTKEGSIILDPFLGSGTTAISCLKTNRKFIGIDKNQEYIKIAEARIKPFLVQSKLPNLSVQEVGTNE